MNTDKVLKYAHILFVLWTVGLGIGGILIVGSGDGKDIPPDAWYFVFAAAICAYIVHLIRTERKERDHRAFLEKYPHMRKLYGTER